MESGEFVQHLYRLVSENTNLKPLSSSLRKLFFIDMVEDTRAIPWNQSSFTEVSIGLNASVTFSLHAQQLSTDACIWFISWAWSLSRTFSTCGFICFYMSALNNTSFDILKHVLNINAKSRSSWINIFFIITFYFPYLTVWGAYMYFIDNLPCCFLWS